MWIDYFNSCVRARNLGIATQIKNMGAPLLVFAGIWYDIYAIIFWLLSENYKIMLWKKKSLKTLKSSSFFRTLFCNSWSQLYHVLFTINIYGIDFKKKKIQT
jgi:hypothetical protein